MVDPANKGEGMLTAEGGNPDIVGRNWSSGSLEFGPDRQRKRWPYLRPHRVRGSCKRFPPAIARSAPGRVITESHTGILPKQPRERRPRLLCEGSAPTPLRHLRQLTPHWYPESLSILSLDPQPRSSVSMRSNSSSMIRLILAVSLR